MKERSEKSLELYRLMLKKGYPEQFCDLITWELNTDFTAKQMIGYLAYAPMIPMEDVADEMLSILAQRKAIVEKKMAEHAQARINEVYNFGLEDED